MIQELLQSGIFSEPRTFKRNDYIKVQDSVDTSLYYIEEGSVRIYILDDDEERIIRFGYAGNILVAMDSFLTNQPSEYLIQAIRTTRLRVAAKKDFYDIISSDAEHLKKWNKILEDLVVQQLEREKDLLTVSPKIRYERVLKRSPQLFQEIPARYIANYLRMTPETLSQLKKS